MTDAVLVVDMQNTFLDERGASVRRGAAIDEAERVIAATGELIAAARAAGHEVIYTRHQYRPDLRDMTPALRALYPPETIPATVGSWDAAIIDAIVPRPGDCVIDKNRFDAFLYTDAEVVLRRLDIAHLIVCGVVTNLCVETTVRSAHQRDLRVSVAADAVGGIDPRSHTASLESMTFFASVRPWRNLSPFADSADAGGR